MVSTAQRVKKRLENARKKEARDALYPDSDSDSDESIEWLGEPLNKDTFLKRTRSSATEDNQEPEKDDSTSTSSNTKSSRRATRGSGLSNIPYYAGFRKGGVDYNLGDVVLLENEQYSRKLEHPHVAQILSLWETEKGEQQGNFRWFHQVEDINKLRRFQKKGNFPDRLEQGEIVYSLDDDKNELDTVVGKCTVLSVEDWRKKFGNKEVVLKPNEQSRFWFCRGYVRRMTGYSSIEWKGNEAMMNYMEPAKEPTKPKVGSSTSSKATPATSTEKSSGTKGRQPAKQRKRGQDSESASEHEAESSESESDAESEESEDNDFEKKKTPAKRKKAAPVSPKKRKADEKTVVPRRSKALVTHIPTTQRAVSAVVPQTEFEHARDRLHVKAVPDTLPCREDEFMEIEEHLESAIQDSTGSSIFIAGTPGTGKTATVNEVIRSLQAKAEEGEISPFQFVEINGMKVTEPSYAYVLLWMALTDQKVTANHALQLLEKRFSTPGPQRLPVVVLLDELDLLVTGKQTVMYNFFEWPTWMHSRLIVVAVANTMDLPDRMLSNKIVSRLGLTRISFKAYDHKQLATIVESRLVGIRAFRKEAIEFAARKVGAVSGDARRALDICRRAVEIVEANAVRKEEERRKAMALNPFADHGDPADPDQVTIRIVDQAIKEMFASPNVRLVQSASLHQKIFLIALIRRLRVKGIAEDEFTTIANVHQYLCRIHNLRQPSLSDLSAICASLGACRCLLVESGKQDIYQRVRLSVTEEDVIMALRSDSFFKRLVESLPEATTTGPN
ncbi:Origin recognition complex, subunit 1 [Gryganskiella cystojenkinii]|nr:Origin recognition complex, subunit 1 [Gryganskiella cystojenkinii]